jgi:hypothetical protein
MQRIPVSIETEAELLAILSRKNLSCFPPRRYLVEGMRPDSTNANQFVVSTKAFEMLPGWGMLGEKDLELNEETLRAERTVSTWLDKNSDTWLESCLDCISLLIREKNTDRENV